MAPRRVSLATCVRAVPGRLAHRGRTIRRVAAAAIRAGRAPAQGRETTLPALLVKSTQEAAAQFRSVLDQLLRFARLLPLTTDVFREARSAETKYKLTFPCARRAIVITQNAAS